MSVRERAELRAEKHIKEMMDASVEMHRVLVSSKCKSVTMQIGATVHLLLAQLQTAAMMDEVVREDQTPPMVFALIEILKKTRGSLTEGIVLSLIDEIKNEQNKPSEN